MQQKRHTDCRCKYLQIYHFCHKFECSVATKTAIQLKCVCHLRDAKFDSVLCWIFFLQLHTTTFFYLRNFDVYYILLRQYRFNGSTKMWKCDAKRQNSDKIRWIICFVCWEMVERFFLRFFFLIFSKQNALRQSSGMRMRLMCRFGSQWNR